MLHWHLVNRNDPQSLHVVSASTQAQHLLGNRLPVGARMLDLFPDVQFTGAYRPYAQVALHGDTTYVFPDIIARLNGRQYTFKQHARFAEPNDVIVSFTRV